MLREEMRVTSDVLPLLSAIKALHREVEQLRGELAEMRARTETMNERGMLLLPPSFITAAAALVVPPDTEGDGEESESSPRGQI